MTTAPARAASSLLSTNTIRAALMAAASSAVLITWAPAASAASCATTTGNDTCVITLGVAPPAIDGQAGNDTLEFNDSGNTISIATDNFSTGANNIFLNFENGIVRNGTTVNLAGVTNVVGAPIDWTIEGILNISNGDAIGNNADVVVAAGGVLHVNDTDTVGTLAGAGSVVIAGTKTFIAGNSGDSTTFSGVISGAGAFTKSGAGTMTLTNTNTFTGVLSVIGGILEIGPGGSIATANGVTTAGGGQLTGKTPYTINGPVTNAGRITGDVTINGNVVSSGAFLPGATSIPVGGTNDNPGQDMGTIQINGNYTATSQNAYFGMFVDLDNHTNDFININGDVLGTLPTWLYIVEFDADPDAGQPTTGNGILMVNVEAGHSVNANAFRQGYQITSGAYQYLIRYVENYSGGGGDDGFFLQSFVRDEMYAQPAMLTAGQTLVSQCFRDGQRVPDSPKGASYGRAWVGYHQGSANFGADTGLSMDEDFSCSTGGMDWRMGYGWFGGISGGFGDATVNFTTDAGPAILDGSARLVELYASFTSSAFFVNLSAGYSDIDWSLDSAIGSGLKNASATGIVASAQAGVALSLAPIAVKVMGAINYDGTNCGDNCFGFTVAEESGLVEAVGTVRFDAVGWGGAIRPWASVSYADALDGGKNSATLGAVSVASEGHREMLMLDAGLQTYLDENFALFADGGYRESLAKDISGYKAGVGLKLYW